MSRPPEIRCAGAGARSAPSVQSRQVYFGRVVTMTQLRRQDVQPLASVFTDLMHDAAAARTNQAAGSMTSSIRVHVADKLPTARLGTGLVVASPAVAARVSFSASTSASAIDRPSHVTQQE